MKVAMICIAIVGATSAVLYTQAGAPRQAQADDHSATADLFNGSWKINRERSKQAKGEPPLVENFEIRVENGASLQARQAPAVQNGVYTEEQAEKGRDAYRTHCIRCHLADLGGDQLAPSLVGNMFLERWKGSSLASLFGAIKKSMPPDAPGSATDEEYTAIVSYLLKMNQVPAGQDLRSNPAKVESIPLGNSTSMPARAAAGDVEWRYYGGDQGAKKYSPLDQINKDTVKNLRIAWRQSATPLEVRQGPDAPVPYYYGHTPLMVGRLLYMSTGYGTVAALDATTGKVVWFDPPVRMREQSPTVPRDGAPPVRGTPTRSLAYWTDGKDARIVAIVGQSLVALNATTGKRYPDFGDGGGEVDLSKGYDRITEGGYKWRSQPVIVGSVIVVGGLPGNAADIISEKQRARAETPPGDIRGYDVRTGKRLWTFHTVPRPGEFGSDTWLKDSWAYSGNTGVWGIMSADDELGYVYIPIESALDYFGGTHEGDNLFADSIVCLDARTGKRVWHFQANRHGIWDYDFTAAPILADVTVDGRRRKIVVATSKQGFAYVLDRVTGQPVWPIEERPVARGHVPGEWYSPTQPFPTKPPAFEQQGVSIDDLIDFTPELRREAIAIISEYNYGPLYTPLELPGTPQGKNGTLLMPSTIGGNNVDGAAVDPETGILYVPTIRLANVIKLVKSEHPESNLPYVHRDAYSPENWPRGPQGLFSPFKPPYGSLVAIDLNRGDLLWKVPNGNGPRDHPALKHLNLPPLGQPGRVGPLVTKTLVFLGEGQSGGGFSPPGADIGGKMFRAYDKRTGQLVWEMELPGGTKSPPMTYMVGGKQYIVVSIGWRDLPGELISLALP